MATPMSASQIVSQLKKWGIGYKEYKSWETHNRNKQGAWGPVNGFMWHHTGSDGKDQRALLYDGYSGLPGPLVQMGIDQTGTVHLIGWGRCNHAGGGDPAVLAKVISEEYSGTLKPKRGNSNGVDGNSRFYGVEIWYSGSHGMTAAQYNAALKLSAAILDFHKWNGKSVIGHGEWSNDKWDPGYASGKIMDMNAVRNDVNDTLKGTKKPEPDKETGPVADKKSTTYKEVWHTDAATPPAGHATGSNPYWIPMSILKGAFEHAEAANKNSQEILKRLAALEKKVS